VVRTITGMSGRGANAPWVQQRTAQTRPERLRFSAATTLRRLEGFSQVITHVHNQEAGSQPRLRTTDFQTGDNVAVFNTDLTDMAASVVAAVCVGRHGDAGEGLKQGLSNEGCSRS
jgi:hypothetical protein